MHGGDQAGIVYLYAHYAIGYHQAPPCAMYLLVVGQQGKFTFDQSCFAISLGNRQAKTVAVLRARGDVPNFAGFCDV